MPANTAARYSGCSPRRFSSWVVAIYSHALGSALCAAKTIEKTRTGRGAAQPTFANPIILHASSVFRDWRHRDCFRHLRVSEPPRSWIRQFFPASDRPELTLAMDCRTTRRFTPPSVPSTKSNRSWARIPMCCIGATYVGSGPVRFYMPLEPPLPDPFIAAAVIVTKNTAARISC